MHMQFLLAGSPCITSISHVCHQEHRDEWQLSIDVQIGQLQTCLSYRYATVVGIYIATQDQYVLSDQPDFALF